MYSLENLLNVITTLKAVHALCFMIRYRVLQSMLNYCSNGTCTKKVLTNVCKTTTRDLTVNVDSMDIRMFFRKCGLFGTKGYAGGTRGVVYTCFFKLNPLKYM